MAKRNIPRDGLASSIRGTASHHACVRFQLAFSSIAREGRMDELLGRQSAFNEAKALFRMIGAEHTVEELRELIAVPPKIEAVLLAYAETFPEEAYFVERVLKFRVPVLEEFDHLVRDGLQVNSPEEEGTELDAIEETYAVAHA